jgi:Calcineurin-like phosphoesterase
MSTTGATRPKLDLKFQALRDLRMLKRSALHSQYRRKVDDLADDTKFPRLKAFLPQNLAAWIGSYLKYAFKRKHAFPTYPATGERGLYRLQAADGGQVFRLAIAGDWGTGTAEANDVARAMLNFNPDYTIHLGDVYYVGDTAEVEENCLGKIEYGYQGVIWPKGRMGSFSMNGNHEMYANGNAYFDVFMPTLGIPASHDEKQLASFFCLENDVWRILALDTGYNSIGLPILGQIPLINKIPGVGADCKLEDASIEWLRNVVRPKERPRATILLTHHQYFSAFEGNYKRPAKQLMEFFAGQDLLWIWGHEHRWAVYDKHSEGSLMAYGRCIGHGGMPVELKTPDTSKAPLQYFDERVYVTDGDTKIGMNGFLNLQIAGNIVTLDYRDLTNHSILIETFTAGARGSISQAFVAVDEKISRGAARPALAPAVSAIPSP